MPRKNGNTHRRGPSQQASKRKGGSSNARRKHHQHRVFGDTPERVSSYQSTVQRGRTISTWPELFREASDEDRQIIGGIILSTEGRDDGKKHLRHDVTNPSTVKKVHAIYGPDDANVRFDTYRSSHSDPISYDASRVFTTPGRHGATILRVEPVLGTKEILNRDFDDFVGEFGVDHGYRHRSILVGVYGSEGASLLGAQRIEEMLTASGGVLLTLSGVKVTKPFH